MAATYQKIVVNGLYGQHGEGELDAIVSPGMCVAMAADGDFDPGPALAAAHAVKEEMHIAVEDALQGKTVIQDYAVGDRVFFYTPLPGDEVQVLLKDGETVAVGALINPEGGGTGLFVAAAGTEAMFRFRALEAKSPSGSNDLLWVRCIQ